MSEMKDDLQVFAKAAINLLKQAMTENLEKEDDTESFARSLLEQGTDTPTVMSKEINPADIANIGMVNLEPTHRGTWGLTFDILNAMARVPVISSVINTRINQVAEFAKAVNEDDGLGFQIRLKDRKALATDEDKQNILKITEFVKSCGDNRITFETDFEGFLRMLVRDSLIFDQACFEIVRNENGYVCGFLNVDSSTIRRSALTDEEKKQGRRSPDGVQFVQVLNNQIVAQYKALDLCWGIRRPRSEIRFRGYGFPELEELVKVITHICNAEVFNSNNFTNGISASGIIAIKSKMNPNLFKSFRKEFYSMLTGASNSKRTPLIQLDPSNNEEVQSINLSNTNREMEYQEWMNYLLKITCAMFQIDPAEIGFNFGVEGQNSAIFSMGVQDRAILSKEKGLRPLLRAIESWINRYIIDQVDSRYELTFVGLDSIPKDKQLEMDLKKMAFMTLNEIRAKYDLPPHPMGDKIGNPLFNDPIAPTQEQNKQEPQIVSDIE